MAAPRIAFGLLCAKESSHGVLQLVTALGTAHPIFIHHDVRKSASFALPQPNASFVPDPCDTGWGTWGFVQAIVKTMRHALAESDFEYFQILSGSCLPCKPIAEFERHVASRQVDVNMSLIGLDESDAVLMSHGYRVLAPMPSLRSRVLSRARRWYLARGTVTIQQSGLGIVHLAPTVRDRLSIAGQIGLGITRLARRGILFDHPFTKVTQPFVGSTWFGCSRQVCEYLVERSQAEALEAHYARTSLVDEAYFHTLIGNSGFKIGISNHFINDFIGNHPRWVEPADMERAVRSVGFFARKFRDDINDPARLIALEACRAPSVAVLDQAGVPR